MTKVGLCTKIYKECEEFYFHVKALHLSMIMEFTSFLSYTSTNSACLILVENQYLKSKCK